VVAQSSEPTSRCCHKMSHTETRDACQPESRLAFEPQAVQARRVSEDVTDRTAAAPVTGALVKRSGHGQYSGSKSLPAKKISAKRVSAATPARRECEGELRTLSRTEQNER